MWKAGYRIRCIKAAGDLIDGKVYTLTRDQDGPYVCVEGMTGVYAHRFELVSTGDKANIRSCLEALRDQTNSRSQYQAAIKALEELEHL
jgi:hypothetical protein